ncbi:MAG TPA: SdiA-regulated domain-containing protein [Ignavibacteriaceae bacterium]|nr:SdiA-regulated domain-containing protein [Ignavibacteriaceae bacterium]
MNFKYTYILFSFLILGCGLTNNYNSINIVKDENFPKWLASEQDTAKQTSGDIFIGVVNNKKHFLIVDDIGKIHRMIIDENGTITLQPVNLSDKVNEYFKDFPKKDFEEITMDKSTKYVYLSVEGNIPDPIKYTGIFRLIFENNDIFNNNIVDIQQIDFEPKKEFDKYLKDNIAYEGLAVDNKYFYLALEGFAEKGIFADSTIIFIADKFTKKIIKEINTKKYGISTICGLYKNENDLYIIDRNNKTIFKLNFDGLEVKEFSSIKLKTNIAGFENLDYVVSFESITMDNENNIYLIDDPWSRYYIPGKEVQKKLDSFTINNFNKYIPAIFRYKII